LWLWLRLNPISVALSLEPQRPVSADRGWLSRGTDQQATWQATDAAAAADEDDVLIATDYKLTCRWAFIHPL